MTHIIEICTHESVKATSATSHHEYKYSILDVRTAFTISFTSFPPHYIYIYIFWYLAKLHQSSMINWLHMPGDRDLVHAGVFSLDGRALVGFT
jgi:hypothetical protein